MAPKLAPHIEALATTIVDSAVKVHRALGPGLLESVYEACLCYELSKRGLRVQRQVNLPIVYDGVRLEEGLRLDILVEDEVICELKAVEALLPVHQAQILSQLRLAKKPLGFLLNFNSALMRDGIRRFVL